MSCPVLQPADRRRVQGDAPVERLLDEHQAFSQDGVQGRVKPYLFPVLTKFVQRVELLVAIKAEEVDWRTALAEGDRGTAEPFPVVPSSAPQLDLERAELVTRDTCRQG